LRNLKNKLASACKVEFGPCGDVNKKDLRIILERWKKNRKVAGSVWQPQFYYNILDNHFERIENAMSLVVDGEASTKCGGWKIPKSSNYYSALGIPNYKFSGS
jgi:hypothetical protein